MALVAGVQAPPAKVMGHAGAFAGSFQEAAGYKVRALRRAGVTMVNHPSKIGATMSQLLHSDASRMAVGHDKPSSMTPNLVPKFQTRTMGTLCKRPISSQPNPSFVFRRYGHFLSRSQVQHYLKSQKLPVLSGELKTQPGDLTMVIQMERHTARLCINVQDAGASIRYPNSESGHPFRVITEIQVPLASAGATDEQSVRTISIPIYYQEGSERLLIAFSSEPALQKLLEEKAKELAHSFFNEKAFYMSLKLRPSLPGLEWSSSAWIGLDNSEYERPMSTPQSLKRPLNQGTSLEQNAAKEGIVYIK